MRRMAELHMSIRREAIDAYPRDLDVLVGVFNHFLDFRFLPRQLGVTEHAFSDGWNTGSGAMVGPNMAIDTLQPKSHVSIVRECDRLLGRHNGRGTCGDEPRASRSLSKSPASPIKQYCIFSNCNRISKGTHQCWDARLAANNGSRRAHTGRKKGLE